ncbi:MAG TPA: cupin domain-containing protein [Stellaceae bacterium]|nr:cupin domain-containing protein [Stellaceae bacterium]
MSLRTTAALGALASVCFLGASVALAEGPVNAGDLKWGPAPPGLPKGAQLAVVSGNPAGKEPFVIRARMPAGYKIAAHSHPTSEYVTVLSGSLHIGMGDKLDVKKGAALGPGGFAEAPAGMHHYAWTTKPTVIQVHGQGPFEIVYVNPSDDPRNKTAAK